MERKVVFVGFWSEALKEIVDFLKSNSYQDEAMVRHMEEVLNGTEKSK